MLIVGSLAAKMAGLPLRSYLQDTDIMISQEEFDSWLERNGLSEDDVPSLSEHPFWNKRVYKTDSAIIEFEIAKPGNSTEVLLDIYSDATHAPLSALYALKMSHRYLKNSPHFSKTMQDIHAFRKAGYDKIPKELLEWSKLRRSETYWYKHPSLNATKEEFFTDDVKYIYDHDSVHRAVALGPVPAYELYKVPGEEVMCSKELFDGLPLQTRLNGVYEEASVLAIERSLAHHRGDPNRAFMFALEKVCTSITSGWFRRFAWEHFYDVANMEKPFYGAFLAGLDNGTVIKL